MAKTEHVQWIYINHQTLAVISSFWAKMGPNSSTWEYDETRRISLAKEASGASQPLTLIAYQLTFYRVVASVAMRHSLIVSG
jgi:hypothetical protein